MKKILILFALILPLAACGGLSDSEKKYVQNAKQGLTGYDEKGRIYHVPSGEYRKIDRDSDYDGLFIRYKEQTVFISEDQPDIESDRLHVRIEAVTGDVKKGYIRLDIPENVDDKKFSLIGGSYIPIRIEYSSFDDK